MKNKLLRNWGLKLASLVLAFILWFLVVVIDDPWDSKQFGSIQVKLTNVELLEKENKVYEILDNTDTVRVTVRAPRSVIDQMRASDIVAEADMSKLTDINTIAINYYVPNADAASIEINGNHDVVKLSVEDRVSKNVYLSYNTVGEVAEGYIVGNITLDQNRIEVSGPESAMANVSSAKVNINVDGITNGLSTNVEIQLFDKEGNEVSQDSITKQTDYAHISVEVLAVKEILVEAGFTGVPAEGYMATGAVDSSPSRIRIAGTTAALAGISRVTIPEDRVDITDAEADVVELVDIRDYLPSNVQLADSDFNGSVAVTAYIEPVMERDLRIPAENLTIVNVPEGFYADFAEETRTYTLAVEGLNVHVEALQAADIVGVIDMEEWMEDQGITELRPGTYDIPVVFELSEEITVTDPVTVRVTVYEEES